MINVSRVKAMLLRYTLTLKHNFDRMTDLFYWPAMDLLLWGLTGLYFARLSTQTPHATDVILSGLVFWIVIWRSAYEINVNLLSEMWDRNLVNILLSPLTIQEWVLSFIIFGIIKMVISLAFSASLAFILYQYNIFQYGFWLLPFITSLLVTGWIMGFLISGLLIRYGERVQTIAWMGIALIAPFSALYYPISLLPHWAQAIASFIPSSYIFEAIREIIFSGIVSYDKIIVSFALNGVYLILSVSFFVFMFKKSRKLGFGRLI